MFNRILNRVLGSQPEPARPVNPPRRPPERVVAAGLVPFFTDDHRACDAVWAEVEAAEDEAGARAAFQRFDVVLRRHLAMEEEVMFPAFEEASGMMGGPTQMMRIEHEQMRAILNEMAAADRRGLLDHGDTLLMLIQQHNAKEEGMLYPMAAEVLGPSWSRVEQALARY